MPANCESTVPEANGVKLLDKNGVTTFRFDKQPTEMNSPFSLSWPTFKTGPSGYLLSLRVCSATDPSNDNQGYLSIYITLLRGDFDQILVFPFPYNISLCLWDQSGQRKHVISTIKSGPNSLSLARPTNEKNDEIGIINFCPLNYLTDSQSIYLKDGTFFVGVFIDFLNTGSIPFVDYLNY